MVKVLNASRLNDGLPLISWEQEVPTGESLYSVQKGMELKIAAVVMVFVFAWAYASDWGLGGAAFIALMVGGLCLGGGQVAFKGGFNVAGVHVPGPPEPSPGTLEEERRARSTAVLGKEHVEVSVGPAFQDPKHLYLFVKRRASGEETESVAAPLSSIQPFELGTNEEWFMDVAQVKARGAGFAPNSWVIVMPTLGHGVIRVAESAGSKAEMQALHGLLTREIVMRVAELEQRWVERVQEDEEAERRRRGGTA